MKLKQIKLNARLERPCNDEPYDRDVHFIAVANTDFTDKITLSPSECKIGKAILNALGTKSGPLEIVIRRKKK